MYQSGLFVCALLLAAVVAATKNDRYKGYVSYTVSVHTREQQRLVHVISDAHGVDVLSPPLLARAGVVIVPPTTRDAYTGALAQHGIQHQLHVADLKAALDHEDEVNAASRVAAARRHGGRSIPYDTYQEWEVINQYMLDLATQYPQRATLVRAGDTFEGRPIYYLRISSDNFQNQNKPVIFIDGGIHAREWIAPPAVTWIMHKLLENTTENDMVNDVDWILLPVVNPDGYKFTHTDVRLWRKTRSTHGDSSSTCPGTDGNRNYNFSWNTAGTSLNPCSDTYAGYEPFSEPETRVVRDVILQYRDRMPLYITVHSYGSMILYPWGHEGVFSWNAYNLHTVATAMASAIDPLQHEAFPNYIAANGAIYLYPAAGAAEDWAHSVGIPLAYTIELPGLDFSIGGSYGFHLSPEFIERVVQETWTGIVAGVRKALTIYPYYG